MIQGAIVILGLCFIKSSHQINYQQALLLSNITNITQLFEMAHITRNGIPVGLYEVLPYFGMAGEQTYVGPGFPNIAMPDECSPRLTTVEIPRDAGDDANVMYWPKCTRLPRCGGCCANNMIRCVPDIVDREAFTVLKVKLWDNSDADVNMNWEGTVIKDLEVHVRCKLECSITARDCNRKQRFESFDCSCRCRRMRTCTPIQRWDLETCSCVCKDAHPVCDDGSIFDNRTCSCRIRQSDQRYSNLEIDNDNDEATSQSSTQAETTTTVATTQSTTASSCPAFCPPFFYTGLNAQGNCVCIPSYSFPGRK